MRFTKSLLWDISSVCNLNCRHCYNVENAMTNKYIEVEKQYNTVIDLISRLGVNHLHLLGGEPLMVKGLFELLQYAAKKEVGITINTNGTLLTDKMLKRLIDYNVLQLTVSLDGANEEDNDSIRGKGTFVKVIRNLKKSAEYIKKINSNMIIQVATVITKKNIDAIHKLPKILKEKGVNYLNILRLYECGNALVNNQDLYVSDKEYLMVLSKLMIECYKNGVYVQFDCKPKVLELMAKRYSFNVDFNSEFNACMACKKIIYMDCKGNLYPCGPISHQKGREYDELTINIFDKMLYKRWKDVEDIVNNRIKTYTQSKEVCKDCKFAVCCSGCGICYNRYEALCELAMKSYQA